MTRLMTFVLFVHLIEIDTIDELRSVLSFDRTFNLSSLYVVLMVFKHPKVVRKSSEEPPIFVGPMLYVDTWVWQILDIS